MTEDALQLSKLTISKMGAMWAIPAVCDSIFGNMNLYAMADGLHVWTNFLLALMDETDSAFAREQKATNPRIQEYTAKYRR